MLHFSSQKEKVLEHLKYLSKYDDKQIVNFKSKNEIVRFYLYFICYFTIIRSY